jgi:prolycopene isomerase
MNKDHLDVIVVGAGFGGSTCAALLAKRGLRVLLLDKNPRAGGKAMPFSKGRFSYNPWFICTAPVTGNLFEVVLEELGIKDRVKLVAPGVMGPIFKNSSGRYVVAPQMPPGEPTDPNTIFDWLEVKEEEREGALKLFTELVMMSPQDIEALDNISFQEWLGRYQVAGGLYGFLAFCSDGLFVVPVDAVAASEAVKSFQDIFLRSGGLFCQGGVGRVAEAFAETVGENGGRVLLGTRVEKITVDGGGVTGVVTSKGSFKASIVVSNAGIQPTVLKLVGEEHFDRSYLNYVKELVPSLAFMGIRYFLSRKVIEVTMGTIFSAETPWTLERWIRARSGEIPDEMPIWYEVPSNYDPEAAPPGKQLLIIGFLGPADPQLKDEEAKAWSDKAEKILFRVFPELPGAIESKEYYTPRDVSALTRDQVLPYQGGECIGLGQIVGQGGKHKPSPKAPIRGLFYVGCDAGGTGVGTQQAVDSGIKVANMVLRYHRMLQASR